MMLNLKPLPKKTLLQLDEEVDAARRKQVAVRKRIWATPEKIWLAGGAS